jgi:hypothetical protein
MDLKKNDKLPKKLITQSYSAKDLYKIIDDLVIFL